MAGGENGSPHMTWQVGDLVIVWPSGPNYEWVAAEVTGVDVGPQRGVALRLACYVNGINTAYATHDELVRAVQDAFEARLGEPD